MKINVTVHVSGNSCTCIIILIASVEDYLHICYLIFILCLKIFGLEWVNVWGQKYMYTCIDLVFAVWNNFVYLFGLVKFHILPTHIIRYMYMYVHVFEFLFASCLLRIQSAIPPLAKI